MINVSSTANLDYLMIIKTQLNIEKWNISVYKKFIYHLNSCNRIVKNLNGTVREQNHRAFKRIIKFYCETFIKKGTMIQAISARIFFLCCSNFLERAGKVKLFHPNTLYKGRKFIIFHVCGKFSAFSSIEER